MSDTTQAGGGDGLKGAPDGVADSGTHGKSGGGESGGGAYPNPHSGKEGKNSPSHGGQTDITYHGGGEPNGDGDSPNAATRKD